MSEFIVIFIASTLAGVGTGFAGLSAAVFIAPMLTVFLDIEAFEAVGIALASDVLASAASAVTYAKNQNIDFRRGKPLAISVVLFTVIGSIVSFFFMTLSFGNSIMTYWMIAATIVLGVNFLVRPVKKNQENRWKLPMHDTIIGILGGAYIGFVCGFQGTGGGLLMLFVLNILLRFEFKTAVGTSVSIMSITALIGAAAHFAINGIPDGSLLFLCVFITLISAEITAIIANRVKPSLLKRMTGFIMVGSGIIMLCEKLL